MSKKRKLTENQQKWVDALRSGKYKQGRAYLKYGNGYCCLGVACDVSSVSKWDDDRYMQCTVRLPVEVVQWLGARGNDPWINLSVAECKKLGLRRDHFVIAMPSLSTLNNSGVDFECIARLIEDHADEIFVP